MHLVRLAASTATALLLFGATVVVADPPNFDFNGYTNFPQVAGVPSTLVLMAGVLTNNGVVPTPVPLDFTLNQYTIIVQGGFDHATGIAEYYANATVNLYGEAIGGSAADYANLATFTDGTLLLGGRFDGFLTRNTFTPTLGNFVGKVDFDAGTLLGLLPTAQDWPFGGGWSRTISGIPAGYVENWDGTIDLGSVAVEPRTWGSLKDLYRP